MTTRLPFSFRVLGRLALLFIGIVFVRAAYGQETTPLINATLEGVVVDADTGEPLAGATLQLAGVTHSTKTDRQGKFRFVTGQKLPFTVIVSYIGYTSKQVVIAESPATIALERRATGLDEVVVTSRRRLESAQEVPLAVSVVGGALVDEAGAFNVNRVKELVPTVQLYSSNPRNTTINIRGLGSTFGLTNDGLDPGVGFYIDGVYYARPAATTLDFVDVEQIEVLRGPQGTLFGKNTTAGAFNITTRKASFVPGATFELSYGNYGFIQAKASVTGPLVNEKLAARLSFSGTQRDGTVYNVRNDRYVNDLNNLGARAQLLFTPNENVEVVLAGDFSRQRPSEGYAQVIAGVTETARREERQFRNIIQDLGWQLPSENAFDRLIDQNSTWRSGNDLGGVSVNVDAKIARGTLTSTTAWRYWNWDPMNDRDFTGLNATAKSQAPSRHTNWSQEVRYAGDFSKKLSGVVGVYAIGQTLRTDPVHTEEAGEDQWRFQQSSFGAISAGDLAPGGHFYGSAFTSWDDAWRTPGLFAGHGSAINSTLESFGAAVFANIDWAITEKLHILPGLRYNYDKKTVDFNRIGYGLYDTTDPVLLSIRTIYNDQSFNFTADESNLTGQLTVAYRANDRFNAFATYSTSYKPVGVNLGGLPNVNGQPDLSLARIKPEYVRHGELGIKTSPARNTILNVVAHLTDIRDFQTQVQDPDPSIARGYLANAEEVRVIGVEIDGSYRPSRNISLYGALAYTDGKYVSFTNAPLPLEETGAAGVPFKDVSGQRLPGISKWAGNIGLELSSDAGSLIGKDGQFFGALETFYRSEFSSSPSPSTVLNIDGYALVNARLGFRATDGFTVFIWSRNLLNQNYFEQLLPGVGNAGHYAAVLGDPRTYGVTLRYAF
ncbi:iron complex outermembrane recepter protein [Parapedobacter composti]|uniref:Iron complex outermembrane recepter protein n=1 Tax=Parapedobacter composti TaxID=623281 RepID=A0A1I1JCN0_9SPHI|nr:TonB-dependent receptor [Parapedobacter composti]SFC43733.1 iron complex outermembrane recepter protein [Parapedobacter composti]